MPTTSDRDAQALLSQFAPDDDTLLAVILRLLAGQGRQGYQASVPLTGFLGPQRTASGRPATHLNFSANLGGLEWLIPQLTPNQTAEDLRALLSEQELPRDQQERIQRQAIDYALALEREHPGTFPQYASVPEAMAAGMGGMKHLFVRPLPTPRPQYPGR
jgi:hypothetical protein